MDRRTFISRIAFGTFAATSAVDAQQTARLRHVGVLREACPAIAQPLVQAMRELGWVEGQNVEFEPRCSDDANQLPLLAADLVRQRVDLIFTTGTGAARAAKQATTGIPIVFLVGGDPVKRDIVDSMSRPGANLTGFALGLYDEKQLQVLRAALPGISRVAYAVLEGVDPWNWVNPDVARTLGVQIQHITVQDLDDFAAFFTAAKQAGAEAALIPDVPRLTPRLESIGMAASMSRLPAIGFRREFAEAGGLLSYSPKLSEGYARIAIQIDKILRGAKPADLPVEQPTRFELVINLKEAKALGLSIPRLVRLSADELIQ